MATKRLLKYQQDPFDDGYMSDQSKQEWVPVTIPREFCLREYKNKFPCDLGPFGAVSIGILTGILALLFVWLFLKRRIKTYPRGNEKMNAISDKIASGARAFLWTEYSWLAVFTIVVYFILLIMYTVDSRSSQNDAKDGARYSSAFLAGALLSAFGGWVGMNTATDANVRTTQAADSLGLGAALNVAFMGGAVTGFVVVGLGLSGLSIMYYLLTLGYQYDNVSNDEDLAKAANALAGFGFGASSIALFARVAGGIFTKAADVGADLVGKIEMDIPEDDARNPAVIADNVGDNVGDVAGMGADLFESFVGSIIAAVSLAHSAFGSQSAIPTIMLPFWIAGAGIVASFVGYFAVFTKAAQVGSGHTQKDLMNALHRGVTVSSLLGLFFFGIICHFVFLEHPTYGRQVFGCICLGLLSGVLIGRVTEYFTSYEYWPVQSIAQAGSTGPATVIIQGLGIGMISTVVPSLILVATILGCNALAGGYGIAMAAVGMLSTLGVTLATDAYGPIADNAGGIAEMAHLDQRVRDTTDALDAMGNTTAATGKGFAIGSAVLTALSLMAAFKEQSGIETANGDTAWLVVDIADPVVLAGVLLGAVLPFLFAALTMLSVQKAAGAIIREVRRQFEEIPGLRQGIAEADSDKCIAISTESSLHEMILPGMYAILSPITIGFLVGPKCLTGLLGGAIASGMMLAIMMANAGGAWDNAKKYIEIEGVGGGKGSDIHKACIVGDTVGDPFKDTSGPSLNILIKLMSIVSLTAAPLLKNYGNDWSYWYYGLIPLAMMIIGTWIVYRLFWKHSMETSVLTLAKKEGASFPDDDEQPRIDVQDNAEFA